MNQIEALEILELALEKTVDKGMESWQPIASTKVQLQYCIAALKSENDRSRLTAIMFYQYAIHEFEAIDSDYASLIHKAAGVVDLMLENKL